MATSAEQHNTEFERNELDGNELDGNERGNKRPGQPPLQASCAGLEMSLLPRSGYEARYTAGQNQIGFAFEHQHGVHAFGSDVRRDYFALPNGLAFVPRGCDVYSYSADGGEYLTLAPAANSWQPPSNLLRFNNFICPQAIAAAHALRWLLLRPHPDQALALEHQALILLDCVAEKFDPQQERSRFARYLPGKRLQGTCEFIDDNLGEKLSVTLLAERLNVSAAFFSRAFKACTGQSPHAYVIARRLSRARQMLTAGNSIAAVAQHCGFSSHAHMAALFQKQFGLSPTQIRRIFSAYAR